MAKKSIGEQVREGRGAKDARALLNDKDYMQFSMDKTAKILSDLNNDEKRKLAKKVKNSDKTSANSIKSNYMKGK